MCVCVCVCACVCVCVYICVCVVLTPELSKQVPPITTCYRRYHLRQMIKSGLPRTVSASSEHLVVKKGASVDTSQRNFPDRWSGIFFRDTWFAFDNDIWEINKQNGWIRQIGNTSISRLKKFFLRYFSRPTCHTFSFLIPDSSLSINTPSCLV